MRMQILSPSEIKSSLPLRKEWADQIAAMRRQGALIVGKQIKQWALLIGPCSIHDTEEALLYAQKIKELSSQLENLFLVMRCFVEKPRSKGGWKGLLADPHLDGSGDIAQGIYQARKLFLDLVDVGVPIACEFLDPLARSYLDDLVSWGMIGARTAASPPHRALASSLPFPVGMKNDLSGDLEISVAGVAMARESHTFLGIDEMGRVACQKSQGNPHAHLVLRGSLEKGNFHSESIEQARLLLEAKELPFSLMVDCAHGNSGKNPKKQEAVLQATLEQIEKGCEGIFGWMLESYLHFGKQPLKKPLLYGVSVTDSCLDWETSSSLVMALDQRLGKICSVHK